MDSMHSGNLTQSEGSRLLPKVTLDLPVPTLKQIRSYSFSGKFALKVRAQREGERERENENENLLSACSLCKGPWQPERG